MTTFRFIFIKFENIVLINNRIGRIQYYVNNLKRVHDLNINFYFQHYI